MNVRILDRYELRPIDALNWQLWELRGGRDGGAAKWSPAGRYYQTLSQALRAVYERELRAFEDTCDLPRAIKEAQAIERRLLAAAEEAAR